MRKEGGVMQKFYWICAGVVVGAAAVLLALNAGEIMAQDGPWGGDGPGRGFPPRMPRALGGGSAMVTLGKYIFVLQGQTLFKIDPAELKVVKTLTLKPERPERPERDDRRNRSGRKGW